MNISVEVEILYGVGSALLGRELELNYLPRRGGVVVFTEHGIRLRVAEVSYFVPSGNPYLVFETLANAHKALEAFLGDGWVEL